MKGLRRLTVAAAFSVASAASATPSTVLWTPATIDTQPFLVPHLTYDTHFGEAGALQIDTGLTLGLLDFRYLRAEAGFDLFFPTVTPSGQLGAFDFAQLNGRVTLPEGALAPWAPGLSIGIANLGFKRDVSNYDLLHATLGKATRAGRFGLGAYYGMGSERLWLSYKGETRSGFLASWVSNPFVLGLPGLKEIDLRIDLAGGINPAGGLGAGVGLRFTPTVQLRTGAVVFLDWDFYERAGLTRWLWTLQLDLDVPLFESRAQAPAAPKSPQATPATP